MSAYEECAALRRHNERRAELSRECDLAAYAVLGTARVLFRLVPDEVMKESGLGVIADYDRNRQALEEFVKEKGIEEKR